MHVCHEPSSNEELWSCPRSDHVHDPSKSSTFHVDILFFFFFFFFMRGTLEGEGNDDGSAGSLGLL